MIRRMRTSGAIRQAWVIFALAAFALRALTPAGFMLGADPESGQSWIYLCQPVGSSPPADWADPFESNRHHPDQAQFDSGCAFTMAGTALTPDTPAIDAIETEYAEAEAVQVDDASHLPAPLNPTAPPRAPPSFSV